MEKDSILNEILLKKEEPQLPEDFEEKIMAKISLAAHQKSSGKSYFLIIWIFFVIGLLTGILISTIWVNSDTGLFGLNFSKYKLFIQILCSVVILLLFEKIYRFSYSIKKRGKYSG